jgi:hypothetical protein
LKIQQFTDNHRKQKLFIVLSELFWGERKDKDFNFLIKNFASFWVEK